ncbi:MAG: minor capsid protein [Microviridae sp.]|nr:MAG: minor capsid protein [Microviridae sp.]
MDPLTAGIVTAGNIAGGVIGNKASAHEAARNRQFQKRMYRHRYQYTVQDMQKAGLNPALAYQQGAGSAPSGSTASQENPIGDAVGKGVSSALAVSLQKKQMESLDAGIAKTRADTELSQANAANVRADTGYKAKWRERTFEEMVHNVIRQGQLSEAQRESLMTSTEMNRQQVAYWERMIPTTVAQAKADLGITQQQAANLAQQLVLLRLEQAPAEAVSNFARTWWGQNVSPAMGDAKSIISAITSIVGMFNKLPSVPKATPGIGSVRAPRPGSPSHYGPRSNVW